MDDTDRISGFRHPARLRRGRLDRRADARVAVLLAGLVGLLATLGLLVPGSPAWAHNALTEASPDKKATLAKAPTEVRLRFLQKLDPDYTTITVSDAAKRKVPASDPEVKDKTGSIELEEALANGVYTVAYQVVSTDGHTVKGSYQFTVDDPDAAPAAPAAAAPASTPAAAASTGASSAPVSSVVAAPGAEPAPAAEEASGNGTSIGVVVAVIVVLAGLAGFLYVRRRKA